MAAGPAILTPGSIGINPSPCTEADAAANWGRLPQLFSLIQNQLTGPGGLTQIITNLEQITNYNNATTNNNQVLVNINGVPQWANLVAGAMMTHWQYDTTSHKFQIKTQPILYIANGAESAWTNNPDGSQPVSKEPITHWRYYTSTHNFEIKTLPATYVLEAGAETGWTTNPDGNQPVNVAQIVTDVEWNSDTANALTQDVNTNPYVLEAGSSSTNNVIDTATAC